MRCIIVKHSEDKWNGDPEYKNREASSQFYVFLNKILTYSSSETIETEGI